MYAGFGLRNPNMPVRPATVPPHLMPPANFRPPVPDIFRNRDEALAYARAQAPPTPASPSAWMPGEFNRPATPYPVSRYAGSPGGGRGRSASSGGGGGGGGFGGGFGGIATGHSYNPMAQFGGQSWPGDAQNFTRQQQLAILGIINGTVSPDLSQPAQVLAGMMYKGGIGNRRPSNFMTGGGGGGGRGGSGGLAGDFQSAFDEARMENEARYRDVLEGHQAGRDMLVGMGAQEREDINTSYSAQEAARRQALVGRGLGNSTIVDTMQMGNERERVDAQGRLEDRLRTQHYGALQDQLRFMADRNDTYPDYAQLERLARGEGEAGVGQPGGVGSGAGRVTGQAITHLPPGSFVAPQPVVSYPRMPAGMNPAQLERLLAMQEARRREAMMRG